LPIPTIGKMYVEYLENICFKGKIGWIFNYFVSVTHTGFLIMQILKKNNDMYIYIYLGGNYQVILSVVKRLHRSQFILNSICICTLGGLWKFP
jgi:hypothetical protein